MPAGDAEALDLGDCASDRPIAEADLVLSLGGDGTMLRSGATLDGAPVPVLGVNVGRSATSPRSSRTELRRRARPVRRRAARRERGRSTSA